MAAPLPYPRWWLRKLVGKPPAPGLRVLMIAGTPGTPTKPDRLHLRPSPWLDYQAVLAYGVGSAGAILTFAILGDAAIAVRLLPC